MERPELIALAKQTALTFGLNRDLVCAIVQQESNWDPFAIRCESESGFMARYGATYAQLVKNSATQVDDKWFKFEDIFYSSYGLMQTMYPVIIETFPEMAGQLIYPTRLCDPATGLNAGCRLFAKKLSQAGGDMLKALNYWNGGGNPAYANEVLSKRINYA